MPPLVSIGMPVHNGGQFVGLALDSLLAQTFGDFELVISDNASTDSTAAICVDRSSRDERVRYLRQPNNLGPGANFATVLREARGSYFAWAAHDDLWEPTFLSTLVAELEREREAVLACCDYDVYRHSTGERVRHHSSEELPSLDPTLGAARTVERLLRRPHPTFFYGLYRTDTLRSTRTAAEGQFDWSDLAVLTEIALLGGICLVPEVLFHVGIADRWRDPRTVESRRLPGFRLGYGQYLRRSLIALARSSRLTLPERVRLAGALLRHLLTLIYLHEAPGRRPPRPRVPVVGVRPTSFAEGADGASGLISGWGESEPWGTWSVARECVLRARLSQPAGQSARLGLRYRTIPLPESRPRVVECTIGGHRVQRWEFGEDNYQGELVIDLSAHLRDGVVELTLVNVNAEPPKDMGIGEDLRTLGIGVEQIRVLG